MIALLVAAIVMLAQAPPPPKGAIHGRAVDKDTGRPLVRAVVRLSAIDGTVTRTAMTDEQGVFTFDGLPPGRYGGFVFARQHAVHGLGDSTGNSLQVSDQIVEISVAATRTFAVEVRVVDALGEALSGVAVEAISLETGRPSFGFGRFATDDLGRLRVTDLGPGAYRLCAESGLMGVSSGGSVLRADRLLRTCYPSNDEADAEPVRVNRSDVSGIEIRMRRGRTFRISGTVVDGTGAAAPAARVSLERLAAEGGGGLAMIVDRAGSFAYASVQPGRYGIAAANGDRPATGEGPREAAFVEIDASDRDVDGLIVQLRPTTRVNGRVRPDDPSATIPAAEGSGLMLLARLAEGHVLSPGSSQTTIIGADHSFTIDAIFGRRELSMYNVPRGWYLKSILYGGDEVIDTPVEFRSGPNAPLLELVLSTRGAVVSGTVVSDDGKPAGGALVCLLRRHQDGRVSVAETRGTARGSFTLGPVRGGEYVVVALPSASEVLPSAAQERLQRLAALGERLTLADLDERSVQLHVERER